MDKLDPPDPMENLEDLEEMGREDCQDQPGQRENQAFKDYLDFLEGRVTEATRELPVPRGRQVLVVWLEMMALQACLGCQARWDHGGSPVQEDSMAFQEHPGFQVPKEDLAQKAMKVQPDHRVGQGSLETRGLLEHQDLSDPWDHQVKQDREENQACLACPV